MIPKVKTWRVRTEDWKFLKYVSAPTRKLALIGVGMDHPETWGEKVIVAQVFLGTAMKRKK